MYRHRNRPKYSDEELAEIYSKPHEHTKWPDHVLRVKKTIEVGLELLDHEDCSDDVIADLSCGDAAIARGLADGYRHPLRLLLGDYAPGYQYHGPIEETIDQISGVDLFICSETIEHLDDPDIVLRKIREKSSKLLLSTPNCSWPDPNPEHYHSWDDEAVGQMLREAGWDSLIREESYYTDLLGQPLGYRYQIVGCK